MGLVDEGLAGGAAGELDVVGDVEIRVALFCVVEEVFGGAVVACVGGG